MAELIPAPLGNLLRRMFREHEREDKIFDLPARKFWRGAADLDTSVTFHGRRAGNPVGPAAGPHDQMAQNLVLAWLAGSRILELKTVQVNDQLTIPRPCIDVTNVGYNVEWSQELRLRQSAREYAGGWMLIQIAREANLLGHDGAAGQDDTIFDMSVGYDLAGIRTPQVRAFIETMKDASAEIAALRTEIPESFARFRDLPFEPCISDQITLSTFHGCPAHEIEGIVRFLLTEMNVHVVVKLNPTLLGRATVDGLLHDVMGYDEIETRAADFDNDLQWEQALEMIDRLSELARSLGRTLGVKFSNTLVVRNHRSFFPASEAAMYLSGQPLHVITMNLVDRWRRVRPELPVSFSAGVDSRNFADCVAVGFTPVTTCTDLLRPGGYGRLPAYLAHLDERMRAVGASTIGEYVLRARGQAQAAIDQVIPAGPIRAGARAASDGGQSVERALEAFGRSDLYPALVNAAAGLNTPAVVEAVTADPRYRAEKNRGVPRKVGSHLVLFDCINCDKCLPVCPNDANFVYEVTPWRTEYEDYLVSGGRLVPVPGGVFEVRKAHQIANFQDFCNECGNCDTFCPEDGGPYIEKPRFFGSVEAFEQLVDRDGFLVVGESGLDLVLARIAGRRYELRVDRERDQGVFSDGLVEVTIRHASRQVIEARLQGDAPEGHRVSLAACLNMAVAADGVLDSRRSNPVNAARD